MQLSLAWERYREFSNPFKTIIKVKDENGVEVLWGHERLIPLFKLQKLMANEQIISQSAHYFKFLPNKGNLAAGARGHKPFISNKLTPIFEFWLNRSIPKPLKRIISFQYNVVAKKI